MKDKIWKGEGWWWWGGGVGEESEEEEAKKERERKKKRKMARNGKEWERNTGDELITSSMMIVSNFSSPLEAAASFG
jgi:hypothetical protein